MIQGKADGILNGLIAVKFSGGPAHVFVMGFRGDLEIEIRKRRRHLLEIRFRRGGEQFQDDRVAGPDRLKTRKNRAGVRVAGLAEIADHENGGIGVAGDGQDVRGDLFRAAVGAGRAGIRIA